MKHSIQNQANRIREEATALAGRPEDLVQRASVYLHLYRHSKGRHAFPLLAAHGALWGAAHFRRGLTIGHVLSRPLRDRTERMSRLTDFATAFKDINRRVCIETYAAYHITGRLGAEAARSVGVPAPLATALEECHQSRRTNTPFTDQQKRQLFEAFFLWEQDTIVHPSITSADQDLDWPLLRHLVLRPPVWFSYMRAPLMFRDFLSKTERIAKGNAAFDRASTHGWTKVEAAINRYGTMPPAYREAPEPHYQTLLHHLQMRPLVSV